MKTFGLLPAQELASLQFADDDAPPHLVVTIGEDRLRLDSICPPRRFWESHPEAPWNVVIERDSSVWKSEYPEAWGETADDDPSAPWNAPEPERDPTKYLDENGDPVLWEMPTIVPLVKIPPSHDPATHKAEPTIAWFEDRVERRWIVSPLSAEELAEKARKVWPDVSTFLSEFTQSELDGIATSEHLATYRLLLASWTRNVWSDDARILAGLDALVSLGILTAERKAEIIGGDGE